MLQPPLNFKRDIQSRDTSLIPIVRIGNYGGNYILLSTNDYTTTDNSHCMPLLLNIPSLKESIDIETRKYKISSVGLNISNFPYRDKRFSEYADETFGSLMNQECRIWWASPMSDIPYSSDMGGTVPDNSAMLIYNGIVRKYDHDHKKVSITLEDLSQASLHIDLPI